MRAAAAAVTFTAPPVDAHDPPRRLRFGAQVDARTVTGTADLSGHGGELHPATAAGYVAKYATKAAADLPNRSDHQHRTSASTPIHAAYLACRALLGEMIDLEYPYRGWGRWADMLGFRGHLATKSRRYSVTLGQLRRARRD